MRVKYRGSRSQYEISFNRKSYNFSKENNWVVDISISEVINYIFGLPNSKEFEVVQEIPLPINPEVEEIEKPKEVKVKEKPKTKKKKSKKGGK